LKTEINQDYI